MNKGWRWEGEAPAEPNMSLSSASAGCILNEILPPAVADLRSF